MNWSKRKKYIKGSVCHHNVSNLFRCNSFKASPGWKSWLIQMGLGRKYQSPRDIAESVAANEGETKICGGSQKEDAKGD